LSIAAGEISQLESRYERLKLLEGWCLINLPARHQQLKDWAGNNLAELCRSLSQQGKNVNGDALTEVALSSQSDSFMSWYVFILQGHAAIH